MTADDRVALTSAWPLFGLRIRSERLVLRLPTDDDLEQLMAVAQAGIHPPDVINEASAGVSRALGYEENGRGFLAPQGVARETQRFRMTVERWRSRPRPSITIEGFDDCRELFGVDSKLPTG